MMKGQLVSRSVHLTILDLSHSRKKGKSRPGETPRGTWPCRDPRQGDLAGGHLALAYVNMSVGKSVPLKDSASQEEPDSGVFTSQDEGSLGGGGWL